MNMKFVLPVLLALMLTACAAPATPPPFGPVEELTFQSGPFKVVGDLRLPTGSGPLQAAFAYRKALGEAGNPKSQVEVFPNADHLMPTSKTGCPDELQKTVIRAFLWFGITHGATSPEQINAEIAKDPYKPGLLDSIPFAPGFLDLIEEWLIGLQL